MAVSLLNNCELLNSNDTIFIYNDFRDATKRVVFIN